MMLPLLGQSDQLDLSDPQQLRLHLSVLLVRLDQWVLLPWKPLR